MLMSEPRQQMLGRAGCSWLAESLPWPFPKGIIPMGNSETFITPQPGRSNVRAIAWLAAAPASNPLPWPETFRASWHVAPKQGRSTLGSSEFV